MEYQRFRDFMAEGSHDSQINSMIDDQELILFFQKEKDVFGAGEDSRITFSKLKHPDDDLPKGWGAEASFSAQNLSNGVKGEPSQHVFSKSDLKNIKIIDRENAVGKLNKSASKLGEKAFPKKPSFRVLDLAKLFHKDSDDAPNFIQASEKN